MFYVHSCREPAFLAATIFCLQRMMIRVQLFPCSSQGIQKKKSVVLCTLDNGNCSVITGCPECLYWFTSLQRKNI